MVKSVPKIPRLEDRPMDRPNSAEQAVRVMAGSIAMDGTLCVPDGARGIVLFAHGSGSSRHSPRNRYVAQVLQNGGLATLLIDLLTAEEDEVDAQTTRYRFDIDLLARRLGGATDWLLEHPGTSDLRIGYFGASTGAAAALRAAYQRQHAVEAIVSRGGRPDLAGDILALVRTPTLLIVGGRDATVIELNEQALARLGGEKQIEFVAGATHLFEEPGALEEVALLAREWFRRYLGRSRAGEGQYQPAE